MIEMMLDVFGALCGVVFVFNAGFIFGAETRKRMVDREIAALRRRLGVDQ